MRLLVLALPALFAVCCPPTVWAQAEKKFQPPKIEKLYVGFQVHQGDLLERTAYKVGLWTPVYIEIFGGSDGIKAEPNKERPHLDIETTDNDDVGTRIQIPVDVDPLQSRLFMGYVKTGHMSRNSQEIKVTLQIHNRSLSPRELTLSDTLGADAQLYLTLGSRLKDFHRAVVKMSQQPGAKEDEFNPQMNFDNLRVAAFETDLAHLPTIWFGYNSVDLMILSTENRGFLDGLRNDKERLKAIAQWVRRGGRLVVPIAQHNQQFAAALLQDEIAWQPAIPVVPPRVEGKLQYDRLSSVASWGGANAFPFQRKDPKNPLANLPVPVATLDPGNVVPGDWEVFADSGADNRPLIARVRYGLGQITYMAFSFEDTAFFNWEGKYEFLKTMVLKLAPPRPNVVNQNQRFGMNQDLSNDLASEILNLLDNFDVKVIPFGYVALFIVLYILVVGPLDFFLLKYVFKRLEWTWITFPSVVLAVSVIAYFAAYALKGRDMKINKIDLVDFDLRTSLDAARKPQHVHAYGQSFFTILSPRIQNYTIGLEPNPAFWGEKPGKVLSVDLMSWLGRPSGGMNNMGRPGGSSGGFFRRPYDYAEDASGLRGVPIPVWTTKAFIASWEQTLPKPPFLADLVYYQKKEDLKIAGKLENHLGVDLVDAWLLYDDKCYPLEDGLKSVNLGATPRPLSIAAHEGKEVKDWVGLGGNKEDVPDMRFNPTGPIKKLLFHERFDTQITGHNHLLRPLDLGWRVKKEQGPRGSTREAILFARVKSASGAADSLQRDPKSPTPTKLWLGELPDAGASGREPPALAGNMNQCTYIRVILPLRAAEE